jgi:hypothetical protein
MIIAGRQFKVLAELTIGRVDPWPRNFGKSYGLGHNIFVIYFQVRDWFDDLSLGYSLNDNPVVNGIVQS